MQKKPTDYTILAIGLAILIAVIASSCSREPLELKYYNAYSPLYNEYFVINSYQELSPKDVVWFNDNAEAVNYATPYVATIISRYDPDFRILEQNVSPEGRSIRYIRNGDTLAADYLTSDEYDSLISK